MVLQSETRERFEKEMNRGKAAVRLGILFGIVGFIYCIFNYSRLTPIREHTVGLDRTDGRFGLVLDWDRVEEVIPGGAAALSGQVKKDDSIVSIHGIKTKYLQRPDGITDQMKMKDDVKMDLIESDQNEHRKTLLLLILMGLFCSWMIILLGICLFKMCQMKHSSPSSSYDQILYRNASDRTQPARGRKNMRRCRRQKRDADDDSEVENGHLPALESNTAPEMVAVVDSLKRDYSSSGEARNSQDMQKIVPPIA